MATSFQVTLPAAGEGGGVACILVPILNDSLALEREETFEVTFELVGNINTDGGLVLDNGRAEAVPGLDVAQIIILDGNGKIN